MSSTISDLIRQPGVDRPDHYADRVYVLAVTYAGLFLGAVAGIVLLVWQGQLFVSLTQRSNVETLTLLFFIVLFGYVAFLSGPAVPGVARVAYFALLPRFGVDRLEVEKRKQAALGPPSGTPPTVMLNVVLELDDQPGEPFDLTVADEAGSLGRVQVEGAAVTHLEAHNDGSNDLLAYFTRQVSEVLRRRGVERQIQIVAWKRIEDEVAEQYRGLVDFARNLERQLGQGELWPKVALTRDDCEEVQRRLAAVCPALRSEAFLPDWEFAVDHKLPVIPEPLGLLSLRRSERRADPVATMGCAVMVVLAVVAVLGLFILFPPWVPGS